MPSEPTDITHKQREVELRRTLDSLEKSNQDLQQFAYSASHDLQEPLRMLSSYLQLLDQRYGSQLDEHGRDLINLSRGSADRMQQLIDDLLAYAQVGTCPTRREMFNSGAVVDQVLADLHAAAQAAQARVIHDGLPTISADRNLIGRVLQNLIGNAIKYRGEQPPRVCISAEESDTEWVFSVSDNGIGFDPKDADRIYVIFERLHSGSEYPGTGLGLAICKRVVERHGGRIWCESTPGEGSTFLFAIPKE